MDRESLCRIEYSLRYTPGEKIKLLVKRGKEEPVWIYAKVIQDTGHLVILSTGVYTFAADKRDIWFAEPILI